MALNMEKMRKDLNSRFSRSLEIGPTLSRSDMMATKETTNIYFPTLNYLPLTKARLQGRESGNEINKISKCKY
tara:strand:+ start:109 stop:327 length:219 start_codon:yes stop_codon:yes gene_type:complete